jgi:hypothetical protein
MKLADNNSFSTIDYKLTATHHDRNIAKIDLFLNGLLSSQAKPYSKWAAVCQSKLPALIRIVSRFAKVIPNIFQADTFVITFDWEYFSEYTLNALIFSFAWGDIVLQERLKESSLYFCQVRHRVSASIATKVTDFCGLESANSTSCH